MMGQKPPFKGRQRSSSPEIYYHIQISKQANQVGRSLIIKSGRKIWDKSTCYMRNSVSQTSHQKPQDNEL